MKVKVCRRSYSLIIPIISVLFILLGSLWFNSSKFIEKFINILIFYKLPVIHWSSQIPLIGLEMFLIGIALLPISFLFISPIKEKIEQNKLFVFGIFTFSLLIIWLPAIIYTRSAVIGGERIWWLGDDAMISMRYGLNLARGHGLVWNAGGERVEGYSNFLWTIYMGFVHLFPIPTTKTSLVILLTNLILSILTIPVLIHLTNLFDASLETTKLVLLAYVFSANLFQWTTSGFEITLLTLLFLWVILKLINQKDQGADQFNTYLIIGFLALVRADAIILSILLYALACYSAIDKKKAIVFTLISLMPFLFHFVFRIIYYNKLLPNTAYLKVFGWDNRLLSGIRYLGLFLLNYPLVLCFAFLSCLSMLQPKRLTSFLIFIIYTAYLTFIGGDAFPGFRFFIPFIPLLLVLAFSGIPEVVDRFSSNRIEKVDQGSMLYTMILIMGMAIFLFKLLAGFSGGIRLSDAQKPTIWLIAAGTLLVGGVIVRLWKNIAIQGRKTLSIKLAHGLVFISIPLLLPGSSGYLMPFLPDLGNVQIGLLIKQNTPLRTKVADTWVGSTIYFSERIGVDFLGKNDAYIASLPPASTGLRPGHNKFNYDYSIGVLKPDIVIANTKWPLSEESLSQASIGNYAFTGQLFLNAVFQKHCLPYPIPIDTWRTIFVCDWSKLISERDQWKDISAANKPAQ